MCFNPSTHSSVLTTWTSLLMIFHLTVGGTSGIGEATCVEFVRNTLNPTIYIVGRNQQRGFGLVKQLEMLNHDATVHFLPSDLTLLSNVDEVCRVIKEKEGKINLLFMTANFLSLKGRDGELPTN